MLGLKMSRAYKITPFLPPNDERLSSFSAMSCPGSLSSTQQWKDARVGTQGTQLGDTSPGG